MTMLEGVILISELPVVAKTLFVLVIRWPCSLHEITVVVLMNVVAVGLALLQ